MSATQPATPEARRGSEGSDPPGGDKGIRTSGGSTTSSSGSSGSGKMKHKKLTVDTSLTAAAQEPKPNFAFSNAGTFSEEDVKISQKGLEIGGSPSRAPPATAGHPDWGGIQNLEELEDTGEILGRGSAGVVKRVRHKRTGRIFALKVIPLDISEEVRKKILLELRTLHNAFNESIVTFYGAFYKEGAISICLELMNGGTLFDIIRMSPIPEDILARITQKLLGGLHYIHKQLHLIHRDIKPQNLLVNSKGEVKITDFGVSGKIENTIGKALSFVGTVTYMSPERIIGKSHSTVADIWSLGLTVLECALGYYPYFPPQAKKAPLTFFQLLESIVQNPPPIPPPSAKYSAEFCNFIAACLVKNPDERPDAASLLNHPWIKRHATTGSPQDVTLWVQLRLVELGKLKPEDAAAARAAP